MIHEVKFKIRDEELILETGKIARQANGAVFARYGGSAVLATVCASDRVIEGAGFIPLSVEYNEKYYAAGKIPGGFFKREGRPRDKEILVSRLIDRAIRPLFSKEFGREIQVVPTTIATDQINPPDILGMIAAYAAVFISDIPFEGPVAAVRVAAVDDELVINPTYDQIDDAQLDIVVAGTEQGITMVEGGAREVSEDLMIRAIDQAHGTIKELCRLQHELRRTVGKEKIALPGEEPELEIADELRKAAYPRMEEACFVKGKMDRSAAIKKVKESVLADFEDRIPEEQLPRIGKIFENVETEIVRKSILEKGVRTDGRKPDEIRPISCQVDMLPRTHGSALFTRGETQSLAITTLGTVYDEQIIDNIDPEEAKKKFMLHYNFPPYSVGETGRLYTGRREIGHGHLAERAISKVLPSREDFPYTIRVVSEILESNGSSSMASVCSGTMSLLNAGVPLSQSVAGIAMGLVKENDRYVVLSDILGEEDHLGDMDFKVAGTKEGITAFQMDIKIEGVDAEILAQALEQARNGRLHILSIMKETISEPRGSISDYAPKIVYMKVDKEKIGAIIGPQGKTIKGISEKTGATVSVDDDGTVTIYAKQKDKAEEAQGMIESIVQEPEVGRVYTGTVKRIMDFGAFVEFLPGKEGLCHISQLSRGHVDSVTDVLEEGQEIPVKLVEIDRLGRINLSYIEAVDPEGGPQRQSRPPRDGGPRGQDRSREDRSSRGGGRHDSRSREGRRDNRRR